MYLVSGRNSAPCRVIVGLRRAQSYIPGVFFSCRHSTPEWVLTISNLDSIIADVLSS